MTDFEWFLLIVVVIAVPLVVAVAITVWTLEQARQRKRANREEPVPGAEPVKRRATRGVDTAPGAVAATTLTGAGSRNDAPQRGDPEPNQAGDGASESGSAPDASPAGDASSSSSSSSDAGGGSNS